MVDAWDDRDIVADSLVAYSNGTLHVLTEIEIPDGWTGRAVLIAEPTGESASILNRKPSLKGYAGAIELSVSLSETHDIALREGSRPDAPNG